MSERDYHLSEYEDFCCQAALQDLEHAVVQQYPDSTSTPLAYRDLVERLQYVMQVRGNITAVINKHIISSLVAPMQPSQSVEAAVAVLEVATALVICIGVLHKVYLQESHGNKPGSWQQLEFTNRGSC